MTSYLFRRILLLGFTLLGLSIIVFIISRVVPADPARLAAGPDATEEMVQKLRKEFGLDDPLPIQYFNYLRGIFRGDLGRSIRTRRPVIEDLATYYPATLELVLFSLLLASLGGIFIGTLSGVYHGQWVDQLSRLIAVFGVGMPDFWLALMLQMLIGLKWKLLPSGGRLGFQTPQPMGITHFFLLDSLLTGHWGTFVEAFRHILLPAISLSFPAFASLTRLTRAEVLDVLSTDFVKTARAKGLSERVVIWRHMLRNALIPTTTMIGLRFGWMLGGTVMVETVFNWPGLGLYAVQSATFADFNAIMGTTLLVGLNFALANLIVDLLYGVLDPRIRYD
jgi:peptide/nickel transport system permease protein